MNAETEKNQEIDLDKQAELFGRVSSGDQTSLVLICNDDDLATGRLLLIRSTRGGEERIFFFLVLRVSNYLKYVDKAEDVASTLVAFEDAYLIDGSLRFFLEVEGHLLGYAQKNKQKGVWEFRPSKRTPEHFAHVYIPQKKTAEKLIGTLFGPQLDGEIYVGDLEDGDTALPVRVNLPVKFLPMHLGIFGSTGAGKSNLMMVLIKSFIDHNLEVRRGAARSRQPLVSAFCIDPHDEFATGTDTYGIHDIVEAMDDSRRNEVMGDFYYLTSTIRAVPREIKRYARELRILWDEIQPEDLYSIMDFSPQMSWFIDDVYARVGDRWVSEILNMIETPQGVTPGTFRAVQRRLAFLKNSDLFVDSGASTLDDIIYALENGRVLIVNTSLMSSTEQFLVTTIVTRTISDLRRALKSSMTLGDFKKQAQERLPHGLYQRIHERMIALYARGRTANDDSPVASPTELPAVMITVEEAPSILNPELMKGRSVFKDVSRQGRKFNIGLIVISQQVSVLDRVILSQMNTQISLRLNNKTEIKSCIDNASINISGYEDKFRTMARGEALLTASYRDVPLPVKIPKFDDLFEHDKRRYKGGTSKRRTTRHALP